MGMGRTLLNVNRSLHLYLTVGGLGLLLFVAVTGFVLNHSEWFERDDHGSVEVAVAPDLLRGPDKLAVVESLRAKFGRLGLVDAFEAEDAEVRITFKRPGASAMATLDRQSGQGTIEFEGRGWSGVLGDLHKAKDAGEWWKWAMDAAALILAAACVTGLVLWLSMPRRRVRGLIALALGTAAAVGVYLLTVP